ncbi:MAG: hypothetical protein R3F20_16715, partial [Planctomycetota bacterium]
RAVRRERGTLALDRLHDGKRGEEPSIHLLWPAAAAFALTAEATGDATFAREAATLFRFAVRHQQGRAENPITFRMQGYPGSESKVLSNIALWGQAALPTLSPR